MQTIFNDYTQRYFFIYSGVENGINDQFCTNDLEVLTVHEMIHRHLQKIGYRRILFYDANNLYYYDYETPELMKIRNEKPQKIVKRKKRKSAIGGRLKRGDSNANPTKVNDENREVRLRKNLPLSEIITNFDTIINDASIKTAIVFPNMLNFIQALNQNADILSLFDQKMASWNSQLEVDNENILIFMEAQGNSILDIKKRINNLGYNFLTSKIFLSKEEKNIRLSSNVKLLFSPNRDEIENLVNYHRLHKNLKIDWSEFSESIEEIVKYTKQNSISLIKINSSFRNLQEFNKNSIYKIFNITSQKRGAELLDEMSGVEYIKDEIVKIVKFIHREKSKFSKTSVKYKDIKRLLSYKENRLKINLNIALVGNPGTGKTTIAKIIASIFKDEGIVEYGQLIKVTKADLVGQYVGETAIKTSKAIDRAIGGVLFIDEAYTLAQEGNGGFGQEAIDTLVEAMTDRKGEFSVIIAGYPDDIEKLLQANAGLKRRFKEKITLKDYEPEVLREIFVKLTQKHEYTISLDLDKKLLNFLRNWFNARDERTFGNAGELEEQIFEKMVANLDDGESELKVSHIPKEYQKFIKKKSADDARKELDSLIGLESVKENISSIINSIKISKLKGKKVTSGHYIFQGNPGTGKTTVARVLGELFKDLKLLKKGHFIEVTQKNLVGTYVGKTEEKTQEILEKSLDGVLFIDEAYTLSRGGENDFGQKAIDTIVPFMENNRDNFTLIVAGYSNDMANFLNKNEGLKSRFDHTINFEDYTTDEMYEIFKIFAKGYHYSNDVEVQIKEKFNNMILNKKDSFGNGREARKLFETLETNQNNRLANIKDLKENDDKLYEFLMEDFK